MFFSLGSLSNRCFSLLSLPPSLITFKTHTPGGPTGLLQCCLICHESLSDNLIALRCGHVYHEACDQSWRLASKKNQCSACKQLCRDKDVVRLFYEISGGDVAPDVNELIQASDGGTGDSKILTAKLREMDSKCTLLKAQLNDAKGEILQLASDVVQGQEWILKHQAAAVEREREKEKMKVEVTNANKQVVTLQLKYASMEEELTWYRNNAAGEQYCQDGDLEKLKKSCGGGVEQQLHKQYKSLTAMWKEAVADKKKATLIYKELEKKYSDLQDKYKRSKEKGRAASAENEELKKVLEARRTVAQSKQKEAVVPPPAHTADVPMTARSSSIVAPSSSPATHKSRPSSLDRDSSSLFSIPGQPYLPVREDMGEGKQTLKKRKLETAGGSGRGAEDSTTTKENIRPWHQGGNQEAVSSSIYSNEPVLLPRSSSIPTPSMKVVAPSPAFGVNNISKPPALSKSISAPVSILSKNFSLSLLKAIGPPAPPPSQGPTRMSKEEYTAMQFKAFKESSSSNNKKWLSSFGGGSTSSRGGSGAEASSTSSAIVLPPAPAPVPAPARAPAPVVDVARPASNSNSGTLLGFMRKI